ncbi:MAG: AmmeMemoRadiSam system radical SAM enzyme [Bacteroidales bacterium]|nr:AmmeMemoRadiSam system radical SAM enzyme [Bacteroidales bacterium]
MFSGQIAADAINQFDADKKYKRVFVITSSHQMHLGGASIYNIGNYETPLGEIPVDMDLGTKLIAENKVFGFVAQAHSSEHSLEVQLPFLQYHLKHDFLLVPIIVATQSIEDVKAIAKALKPYFNDENIFVFSSDFSHYPKYSDALVVDKETADAICTGNPNEFLKTINEHKNAGIKDLATDICGWTSVLTLMYLTEDEDYKYSQISYANSGDSPHGDKSGVVGYHAIAVSKDDSGFSLSNEDKKELLNIARSTLSQKLEKNKDYKPNSENYSKELKSECGVFVTLNKNNDLRGCIGRFNPDIPLYQLVGEMALASAFNDTRFQPLRKEELNDIEIEISVLTPMVKIKDIDEIELGKHGIYIKSGYRSGTFLPQVATQTGWTKEEFLGHCSRDKAGIGWEGWKNAEVYIYEAIVFDESMFENTDTEGFMPKLYELQDDGRVKCLLCPHNCVLAEGKIGACYSRKAENRKIKSLTYGKIAAVNIDPIEKKPLYHYLPNSKTFSIGTAGCNMHCKNCQNPHISQVSPSSTEHIQATPEQVIANTIKSGCGSISYTYNEPTVYYEFMLETAKLAHENGLKNIMVSNGFMSQLALNALIPYLDAANIDLKTFNDDTYKNLCSARLQPILETLIALKNAGVWLEITNLIVPEYTDNMEEIAEMCKWLVDNGFEDVPLHFSRFFPAYKLQNLAPTPEQALLDAYKIAKDAGIKYVYLGNVQNIAQETTCHKCGHKLIDRKTYTTKLDNKFSGTCPNCKTKIPGVWK